MRQHGRVDDNQRAIVDALLKCGAAVISLASLGNGIPDLLVSIDHRVILVEIKDGAKPPSARRLTEAQEAIHQGWPVIILESIDEAIKLVRDVRDEAVRRS